MRPFHEQPILYKFNFQARFPVATRIECVRDPVKGMTLSYVIREDGKTAFATSYCSKSDQWCKKIGRAVAEGRAMMKLAEQPLHQEKVHPKADYLRKGRELFFEFVELAGKGEL